MAKMGKLYSDGDTNISRGGTRRIPVMPNPIPIDIYELIQVATTMSGLAVVIYKLIRLWIEDRKARKIIIRKGDQELEIHGGMTEKDIQRALSLFSETAKVQLKKEFEIIIPDECDPDIPMRLWFKSKE